ncbi:MAG: hypothetical protein C4518_10615 [Desulfobacteraceae bacterium]|nr:MAG: hypothetical protein C4518_10615 [Desulfobacteraceae bacterium]
MKIKRNLAAGILILCCALLITGSARAIEAKTTQGTVTSVENYVIHLDQGAEGFMVAPSSMLEGVSVSSLKTLVGKTVSITYVTGADQKNQIQSLKIIGD